MNEICITYNFHFHCPCASLLLSQPPRKSMPAFYILWVSLRKINVISGLVFILDSVSFISYKTNQMLSFLLCQIGKWYFSGNLHIASKFSTVGHTLLICSLIIFLISLASALKSLLTPGIYYLCFFFFFFISLARYLSIVSVFSKSQNVDCWSPLLCK